MSLPLLAGVVGVVGVDVAGVVPGTDPPVVVVVVGARLVVVDAGGWAFLLLLQAAASMNRPMTSTARRCMQ